MTGTAILCSGQGAQAVGMFDLLADAPEAATAFDAGRAALGGHDPRELVRTAGKDELHANKAGQVLCCVQAMAAWAVLRDIVPRPLVIAGYSVGELAAWGVAGVLDAGQVLEMAVERASAMDDATEAPSGMIAVRGLSRRVLEALCREHSCNVAIVNSPDRMLAAGERTSMKALAQSAEVRGATVTDVPVAVASHTPKMRPAAEQFRAALERLAVPGSIPPGVRLLSGVDGDPVFSIPNGMDKLARQIRQTVDWAACMDACASGGVATAIELGPGNALARVAKEALHGSEVHSLSEFRSLTGVKRWLAEARQV